MFTPRSLEQISKQNVTNMNCLSHMLITAVISIEKTVTVEEITMQ